MTTTSNRAWELVPANTLEPSVPVNAALNALDSAVYGTTSVEFATDANVTLTQAQCDTSALIFTDSPSTLTTGRDVVFPAHFPLIFVKNSTAQTLTLKKSGQTGISLTAGDEFMVASGLTDVERASMGSSGGAVSSVNGQTGAVTLTVSGLASVQTITSAATVTPVATNDEIVVSAQAAAIDFANPTGTEAAGQGFVIALKDNGTARAITWGTSYRAMGAALPTTTVASKWMYIPVLYNVTDDKWDVLQVSQQA